MRLKDFSTLNPAYKGNPLNSDVSFVPMESLRYGNIDLQEIPFSEGKGKYTFFANGDLLLAKVTPCVENGNIAIANNLKEGIGFGSSEIFVLRMGKSVLNTYMFYMVQTGQFQDSPCATMCGVGGLKRISPLFMRTYELYIPSLSDQQRIVDYLDSKTGAIDKRIELLEKKRSAYIRLKTATINLAVTRGLDKNIKLKDSGVEWIGMIPEHWTSLHLKNFVTINNGCDYKHIETEKGVHVIGSGGIFACATNKLYDGEFLLLGRKGTIDKPMYYKGAFWVVDTMFYAIPMKNVSAKFLYYCATRFPFSRISTATALPSMTQRDLYQLPVVMPPYEEQQAIVSYLDEKIAKIDAAIANIYKQTDALKRLKRSLINEVVTGKRNIE